MKGFRLCVVVVCGALLGAPLFAERFEFKHETGDKFRSLSTTHEEVWINHALDHRSLILNKISTEVTKVADGNATHSALFQIAEKKTDENSLTVVRSGTLEDKNGIERAYFGEAGAEIDADTAAFTWTEEKRSVFTRDSSGHMTVADNYEMPTLRDVPVFPDRDLSPGDSWLADGVEVHDLGKNAGLAGPVRLPFKAHYTFLGEKEWKNKSYPTFTVDWTAEARPNGYIPVKKPQTAGKNASNTPRTAPRLAKITGKSHETVYWDREVGQAAASESEFSLIFQFEDASVWEFRATADAEVIEAEAMDRNSLERDIEGEIARLGIDGATVRAGDEGVVISLDDIQFAADSSRLLPSEREKLARISEILKKYGERDILIGGHTALAGNAKERQRLSTERAAAVARYFVENKVRENDRIMVRGYGAEKPVADNTTEAGRSKNRRVEITILEN